MNGVLDRSGPVKVPGGTSSASLRPRSGDRALDDRAELQVWTGSGASGRGNDRILDWKGDRDGVAGRVNRELEGG